MPNIETSKLQSELSAKLQVRDYLYIAKVAVELLFISLPTNGRVREMIEVYRDQLLRITVALCTSKGINISALIDEVSEERKAAQTNRG